MLYKLFSSLKTSIFILSFMALVFLISTIFSQARDIEDYIETGGKHVFLVRALDFLDIYMSPLFIFIIIILLANLAVCLYYRLKTFLKIKRKSVDFEKLKTHPNVYTLENADIEAQLGKAGFKLKVNVQDDEFPKVKIFEKGLQYWWLSWFYHVGIILAIFGFFLTALFAVEKDVILYPGKPETISLYSKETEWNKFLKYTGIKIPEERQEDEYIFTLKEFKTEYYEGLKINYPEDKIGRLAFGIGIKKIEPLKKGFSYMPKMWLTRLDIKKPDGRVLDAELRVNRPYRTGGLTLYQMGYEQKAEFYVTPARKKALLGPSNGANGEKLIIKTRVPFELEGIKGKFVTGSLKLGTLFKKDNTQEKITPRTTLYYIPEEKPSEREVLGELILGKSLEAKAVVFEFKDYKEASYLSYRKDPGVWLVRIACLFVFLGLFVRSLGSWYRVQCAVGNGTAYVLISTRGILADKNRIIRKLQK